MTGMCPYCGRIVSIVGGLTARHDNHNNSGFCKGSRENARCAESDGRPLWNGKPNPHFYRNQPAATPLSADSPKPSRAVTATARRWPQSH